MTTKQYLSVHFLAHFRPVRQFLFVLVACFSAIGLSYLVGYRGETQLFLTFAGLVFYAWVNSVLGFFQRRASGKYLLQSFAWYVVLVVLLFILLRFCSDVSIATLPEYQTLFVANLVFYGIASSVVTLMGKLAQFTGIDF